MRRYGPARQRARKGLAEMPAAAARPPAKGERLDLRLPRDVKALIQKAADLEGRSVSDFILFTVLPEARRVVIEQSVILMSDAGQARLHRRRCAAGADPADRDGEEGVGLR